MKKTYESMSIKMTSLVKKVFTRMTCFLQKKDYPVIY